MAGRLLLDTNIVIDFLTNVPEVARFFTAETSIYLSATVIGELYYGAYKSKRRDENIRRIEDLYATMTVLPNDKVTAEIYGQLKAVLKAKGKPIPENDIWIAATAKQHDLWLATRDKHFSEVPGIQVQSP